jgi:hypothetical protein
MYIYIYISQLYFTLVRMKLVGILLLLQKLGTLNPYLVIPNQLGWHTLSYLDRQQVA